MFFYASKFFGFFLQPSNAITLIVIAGIVLLLARFHRAGRRLLVIGLVLLCVVGFSPLGNVLMATLEDRFPPWDESRGAPHGIVILGGAIAPDLKHGSYDVNDSVERVLAGIALARRYPHARVIYSAGIGTIARGERTEAQTALQLFEELGMPHGHVIAESESRNTYENALFSKSIANPKPSERWLLVTSANHMPRSVGVFRQVDFLIEPYPVDWRTAPGDAYKPFLNITGGLRQTDVAMHEWIGLLAYWLTGKSPQFFPGPDQVR